MRKEKQYHFIYKTTNLLSGRYYIGMHSSDSLTDGYLGSGTYLRRAINKHGKENFEREILEFCKTREELKSRENEIVTLNEIAKVNCMNLRVGGGFGGEFWLNHKPTSYWLNKSRSDATKEKIANGNKNKILSHETKEKISKNHSKYWTDKTRSDVTKLKMSEARLGIKLSDETKLKMSKSRIGKTHTDESKLKMQKPKSKIECPYCSKVGGSNAMKRWHFDNCKNQIKKL